MMKNKLNLNSLLVKRQIDNPSPGAVTGGNESLALTREVNLDMLSSDSSEELSNDLFRFSFIIKSQSITCPLSITAHFMLSHQEQDR